jgi:WS/DGAT/MGAT family acyltransferase
MAQQHLDRLNGVDAGFLHQESATTHMHIGAVAIFEGPPPTHAEFLEHIRARLPLVPRYRQKLAAAPLGLGRQRWVDDPSFNLEYHVRRSALPAPGDEERLRQLTARLFSQALDRSRPLWEMWLVEGLSGGRFALISKTHHALVDGISGIDLMTTLFDVTKAPRVVAGDEWVARPEPSAAELTAASMVGAAGAIARLPLRVGGALSRPGATAADAAETVEGVAQVLGTLLLVPAPRSPLNQEIGPHRRIAFVPARLDDFKTVKDALGGTVNDVVLAVVAGALRRLYEFRGDPTDDVTLRVQVPVSTRRGDERGAFGNRITQMVAPLPVGVADPVERLRVVSEAMADLKESKQALGAESIAGMQDFAPPTILAQASRLNFNNRMFNLLVTNVPGPQLPLYALGRRLLAVFPIAFLAGDRSLAVAIMSYDGGMNVGLLGDYDTLPDIDVIAAGFEDSLAELVRAAGTVPRPKAAEVSEREGGSAASAASSKRPAAGVNGRGRPASRRKPSTAG